MIRSTQGSKLMITITLAVWCLATGLAWAQVGAKEVSHAVVLPVIDKTGRQSQAILDKATAAVALALEDAGEFTVVPTSELERELAGMGLRTPLNPAEQLRLAERLHADKVMTSYLHALAVDGRSGAGECQIEVQALDVRAEEITSGGTGVASTKPIPGWDKDIMNVVNELLRQAAELAVRDMLRKSIRRGFVEMIDDLGAVHVNLGMRDGIAVGQELVVMRGYWQRELEKTVMRKIGTITVKQVASDRLTAAVSSGMPPRTGDRVYVLYRPVEVQKAVARGKKVTKGSRILAALGLAAGIVATGLGGHTDSPPAGGAAPAQGLATAGQAAPGQTPTIRVTNVMNHPNPDYTKIKGYVVFRGETPYVDTDDPESIVHVSGDSRFSNWDDDMTARAGIVAQKEWTFIGRDGEEEDASYEITYNHRPLEPGRTYYYRLRRIVSPYQPQVPMATEQARGVRTAQEIEYEEAEWEFEPNMDEVLSDPSAPMGPVTYILPALPSQPRDGLTTINPREITFVWDLQTPPTAGSGARNARYVLLVFRADDLNNPVYQSEAMRPTATMTKVVRDPNEDIFQRDTDYVWMVGHYVEGESRPNNKFKMVLSEQYHFRTVSLPPSPLMVRPATGDKPVPVRRGWWGETRSPRGPR
ncbi:MAG: hypothetical protein AB7W28_02625 [Armatimonadota bacterium]